MVGDVPVLAEGAPLSWLAFGVTLALVFAISVLGGYHLSGD